jgi:hypothetical protein
MDFLKDFIDDSSLLPKTTTVAMCTYNNPTTLDGLGRVHCCSRSIHKLHFTLLVPSPGCESGLYGELAYMLTSLYLFVC